MTLDPIVQILLGAMAAAGGPPLHEMTPEQARAMPLGAPAAPEDVARAVDRTVPGPGGDIPVRVYTPAGAGPKPVLVYFHGGGWVIGSIESHDGAARSLANAAGCVVVSVEYRLAPEHKFPAAVDDGYAATAYIAAHAKEFGGDASRIAVGGDSAGGNIAAVTAIMARDRGGPSLAYQLLIYPVTDHNFDTVSYVDNAEGYFLTRAGMRWFWGHYLAAEAEGQHPYASPLRAKDLTRLPPALIATAEYDPLRDEGEAYAARLREAGVDVTLIRYDGLTHAFVSLAGVVPAGQAALAECAAVLRAALHPSAP
jgi:acetyl esterase